MLIIIILIALTVWACCKASAESKPYPCRYCEEEYCTECEYWKEWTHDE